jgi:hypothetical protein
MIHAHPIQYTESCRCETPLSIEEVLVGDNPRRVAHAYEAFERFPIPRLRDSTGIACSG